MALTQETRVDRIIISLNDDGSIKGASQISIETITDGTTVISQKYAAPVTVSLAEIGGILPSDADLLAEVTDLTTERDNLQAELLVKPVLKSGISKLALIDRLSEAGLFAIALGALKSDALQYERWQALTIIDPENPEIIGLLTAIGGDLAVLLRP